MAAREEDEDNEKEVVQLRYLQKSNEEQMDKLYRLVRKVPMTIHHYLQKTIFPNYTRSQRVKISASGQAVGGDMLVVRAIPTVASVHRSGKSWLTYAVICRVGKASGLLGHAQ